MKEKMKGMILFMYFKKDSNEEKLDLIRCESLRLWNYLKETIDFIENKYYLYYFFDINELLGYCKSCEESYETIAELTYEIETAIYQLQNDEQI